MFVTVADSAVGDGNKERSIEYLGIFADIFTI